MTILYICNEFPPGKSGGIGAATSQLANALTAKGHKVLVAGLYQPGYGQPDYEETGGIHIWRKRLWLDSRVMRDDMITAKYLRAIFSASGLMRQSMRQGLRSFLHFLYELVETWHVDVIEWPDFNEWLRVVDTEPLPQTFKVPIVSKLHGTDTYIQHQLGERVDLRAYERELRHLRRAAALVAVSEHTAQEYKRYYNLQQEIPVLHNCVALKSETERGDVEPIRIVFAGTLSVAKGVASLMKAWNRVHEKHPEARLEVWGKGNVSLFRNMLNASSRKTVVFGGFIQHGNIQGIYRNATAAVFPSYTECFSMAPIEAMSAGCPVIYTKRSSGKELINDGMDGLLVEPDNIEDIASAINRIIEDMDFRSAIGANARNTVERRFNAADGADRHLAFYNQVIQKFNSVHA